jgi:hypothetical protein
VLYISALVVWCYGFALEGPIQPSPSEAEFSTYQQKEKDMRAYLERVAGVRAPDDLEAVKGKNRCLGMLLILKESFESTRWELTHEAAGLLGNACAKLRGIDDDTKVFGPGSISRDDPSYNSSGYPRTSNGYARPGHEGNRDYVTVANAAKV